MALIVVVSPKGGVGKTTSAITLVACLAGSDAAAKSTALLWDLDPGADATMRLRLNRGPNALSALLAGRKDPTDGVNSDGLELAAQSVAGISVVAAGDDIAEVEERYASIVDGINLVAHRFRELSRNSTVVLDTAPGLKSLLVRAALSVADLVIVPVIPEPRAERHVFDVQAALRGLDRRAELSIVTTMVGADSGGLPELHAALEAEKLVIAAVVPREAVVNDSIWSPRTILESAPESKATRAYLGLAKRLLRGSIGAGLLHDAPIDAPIARIIPRG
jgi:cellulose biosynthesis protein BcsQ